MIPNINNLISVDLLQRFKDKFIEYIVTPIVGQLNEISNKIPAEASSSNQLADKAYVTREVSKMDTLTPVVTDELPVASSSTLKKLYLIPASNGQGSNVKDEYITVVNGLDLYSNYAGTWNHPVTYKDEAVGWYPDADVPGRDKTIGEILLHHDSDLSDLLHSETVEAIEIWEGDYYGGYPVSLGDAYKLDGEILIATPDGWKTEQQIRECNPELDGYDWRNIYAWEKIGSTAMSVDNVPTMGSSNLVKSGGVYSAIENAKNAVKNAVKVTTSELRNLKSSQGLSGGTWYEITDYHERTISDATAIITIGGQNLHPTIISDPSTAAYHNLGLYVLALGVETLSDEGFAVCENLRYPKSLKVRVDISSSSNKRPSWADSSKPWIYWMQDENGNEAPFDFINIGFKGTLDSTVNTEGGITNGILPQTSDGWYAFNSSTITMGSTVLAVNGAINGTCKNCKITGYNIIFGKTDGITIEGSGNIVRNTHTNSLENVIIRGDGNKQYTVHYADGSNSVIQGSSNIIVNSNVTMGKNNTQNIIKSSNTVVFGENNSYFEIEDASTVTIGNNNQYWDIEASDNIVIGDHNIGSSSTHCLIGTTTSRDDGDISENVTIGNHNVNIRIYNAVGVTIGNNNNGIELGQNSTFIEQLTINDNCSHIIINQYDDNSVNAVVLAGTDGNNESITLSPDADGYTQILTYNRGWDKLDRSVWLNMGGDTTVPYKISGGYNNTITNIDTEGYSASVQFKDSASAYNARIGASCVGGSNFASPYTSGKKHIVEVELMDDDTSNIDLYLAALSEEITENSRYNTFNLVAYTTVNTGTSKRITLEITNNYSAIYLYTTTTGWNTIKIKSIKCKIVDING